LTVAVVTAAAATANAAYIEDNYTGKDTNIGAGDTSTDYSGVDVVGDNSFQVYGADISVNGTELLVKIDTNFTQSPYPTSGKFYGDLFISINGYNPATSSDQDWGVTPISSDTLSSKVDPAAPGEVWEYVFDTDAGQLLSLDGSEIITQGRDKQGQEFRLESGGTVVENNNSSFTALEANSNGGVQQGIFGKNLLVYSIDLAFLGDAYFQNPIDMAVHWTMYCANDVFETRVSEPNPLALLGLGLAALGFARRKQA
jgi:hypothetical protein